MTFYVNLNLDRMVPKTKHTWVSPWKKVKEKVTGEWWLQLLPSPSGWNISPSIASFQCGLLHFGVFISALLGPSCRQSTTEKSPSPDSLKSSEIFYGLMKIIWDPSLIFWDPLWPIFLNLTPYQVSLLFSPFSSWGKTLHFHFSPVVYVMNLGVVLCRAKCWILMNPSVNGCSLILCWGHLCSPSLLPIHHMEFWFLCPFALRKSSAPALAPCQPPFVPLWSWVGM